MWPKILGNWFFVTIMFAIGLSPFIKLWSEYNFAAGLIAMSLGVALIIATLVPAFVFFLCLAIQLFSASKRTGLGVHEYEIGPDGIQETTAINSDFSQWESFQRAYKSKNYILLKRHWAAMHIFPVRDFESRKQFNEFFDTLTQHVTR